MKLSDLRNSKEGVVTEHVTIYAKENQPIDTFDSMVEFVQKFSKAYFEKLGFSKVVVNKVKSTYDVGVGSKFDRVFIAVECYMGDLLTTSTNCQISCNKSTSPAMYAAEFGVYGISGNYCTDDIRTDFAAKGNIAFSKKFRKE